MAPHPLTESLIRQYASPDSFYQGQDYARKGAVVSLVERGATLQATVEGNQPLPYSVHVTFSGHDEIQAHCSCPYAWGDWCKHIVAALLVYLEQPQMVDVRPDIDALLADLSAEQLRELVFGLVASQPDLVDVVERDISLRRAAAGHSSAQTNIIRHAVDTERIRRDVRAVMMDRAFPRSYQGRGYGIPSMEPVERALSEAQAFIDVGDGRSALPILDAITDEFMSGWRMTFEYDEEGESLEVLTRIGLAWTEAFLSVDLSKDERDHWIGKMDIWLAETEDYGLESTFGAAVDAAAQGWDYPPLVRVLQGEITHAGAWEGEPSDWADELALVRLKVLERQGRYQEYLNLAEAEGQTERHAVMLARMGRIEEAVAYGLRYLSTADDALGLATALADSSQIEQALKVAEHGLTLDGPKSALAAWTRDLAASSNQMGLALRAAEVVVREQPMLPPYLRLQELAGDRWGEYRARILPQLRKKRSEPQAGIIDILLHERLHDDAIAVVRGTWNYHLLDRVVQAVQDTHPDWVIQTARAQAESIMDQARSNHYDSAVRWLGYAREAYLSSGRAEEWRDYHGELLARHARKPKLRPMLQAMDR